MEPATGIVITNAADKGNTNTFFSFLIKAVRTYAHQKVIMVLDNVRYHHAKRLKPILERYKHRMELIYLPAYSPDLNPMERIWWYMRKRISHNRYIIKMKDRLQYFNQLMDNFKQDNQLGKNLTKLIVNI